jgi:hypothetical protein
MTVVSLGENIGRFVVGQLDDHGHYVIIRDYRWWLENIDQIDEWLDSSGLRPGFKHEGMVLSFDNPTDLSLFILRWS